MKRQIEGLANNLRNQVAEKLHKFYILCKQMKLQVQ
jgi:hypothetical protein